MVCLTNNNVYKHCLPFSGDESQFPKVKTIDVLVDVEPFGGRDSSNYCFYKPKQVEKWYTNNNDNWLSGTGIDRWLRIVD